MKFNRNIIKSLFVLVVVTLFCACQDKENYLRVVPNSAIMTTSIDCASMAKKGDLANNNMLKGVQALALMQLPTETQTVVQDLLNDPTKSGIDFSKPLVVSVANLSNAGAEVIAALAVKDEKVLSENIEKLLKDQVSFTAEGDAKVATIQDGITVAYDNTALVLYVAQGKSAKELLSLPSDKQALKQDAHFGESLQSGSDIILYYNYDALFENPLMKDAMAASSDQFSAEMLDMIKNFKAAFDTNFEDGQIVTTVKSYNAEKAIEMSRQFYRETSGKGLDYVPATPALAFTCALQNLSKLLPYYGTEINQQVESGLAGVGLTAQDLDEIEGDITAAFIGLTEEQFPTFYAALDLKSDKLWNVIKPLVQQSLPNAIEQSENVFAIDNGSFNINLAYVDNKLVIAAGEFTAQLFQGGKLNAVAEPFSATPLAGKIQKGGLAIDFKAVSEAVSAVPFDYQGIVVNILSKFDNLYCVGNYEDATGKCVIEMVDKETNSLKQLFNISVNAQ